MQLEPIKIKVPVGLVTALALKRSKVATYETHRGFKALAFYLIARTLTTSNGIYRGLNEKQKDGYQTWSSFNKQICKHTGLTFNTVSQTAKWAEFFGFITISPKGYFFNSIGKISIHHALYFHSDEIDFQTITINPQHESLEHILKTFVFGENFDKQEYAVLKKINQIPGVNEKLSKYIYNWQTLQPKELLRQIVMWQKQTFINYTKGTEIYDFFHSIHADIALTVKRIKQHFGFKSTRSCVYLKNTLKRLNYITVENRALIGNATCKPHEPSGKCKPITFVYLPRQKARKWLMPDLITINLKNT